MCARRTGSSCQLPASGRVGFRIVQILLCLLRSPLELASQRGAKFCDELAVHGSVLAVLLILADEVPILGRPNLSVRSVLLWSSLAFRRCSGVEKHLSRFDSHTRRRGFSANNYSEILNFRGVAWQCYSDCSHTDSERRIEYLAHGC